MSVKTRPRSEHTSLLVEPGAAVQLKVDPFTIFCACELNLSIMDFSIRLFKTKDLPMMYKNTEYDGYFLSAKLRYKLDIKYSSLTRSAIYYCYCLLDWENLK